jgi:hypothetical protein
MVATLERRGLVDVDRRAIIEFAEDGRRRSGGRRPGERPTHREGDAVSGAPGDEFAEDVVVERLGRPIIGTLVSLAPAGMQRALGV